MPAVCSRVRLNACPRAVAGILRDTEMVAAALGREGHRLTAERRILVPGDEVRIDVRLVAGLRVPMRTMVTAVSSGGIASSLVSGPFRRLEHVASLSADGGLTELHDEVRWTAPALDLLVMRARVRGQLAARARELTLRVATLSTRPVVVATAIVRDGRVLAAQRIRPSTVAGRWELPGGRVEAGEAEAAAVVRECREEMGVHVRPVCRLGTDLPIDAGVLRVHLGGLAPGSPEPQALEHAALRWLDADELGAVDWIDADRAVLPELADLLRA